MNSVTCIIYIHNHASYIESLFLTLKAQEGNFRREYIIIEDGSSDDSLKQIKTHLKYLAKATVLSHDHIGSAASIAKGLSLAHGEYIFLMSGNYQIPHHVINHLLQGCIEQDVSVALASGNEDKHYYKMMNPLVDVVSDLRGNIASIGVVPTLVEYSAINSIPFERLSYLIAPTLALYLAAEYAILQCPVAFTCNVTENELSAKQQVYYNLHPLSLIMKYAQEDIGSLRSQFYLSIMQEISKIRRLTLKESIYRLRVKYTRLVPPAAEIRQVLNRELQKII